MRTRHSTTGRCLANLDSISAHLWPAGVMVRALDSRLEGSLVRVPAFPLSDSNLGQVVRTHVPLIPSNIRW